MVKKITIALVILLMLAMVGLILVDRFDFSSYLHSRSENGNAVWNYEIEEGTVTLTAYLGRGDAPEIPEELDGKKVAGIGDKAFIYQETIKKHHDTNEEQIDFGIEVTHAKYFSEI